MGGVEFFGLNFKTLEKEENLMWNNVKFDSIIPTEEFWRKNRISFPAKIIKMWRLQLWRSKNREDQKTTKAEKPWRLKNEEGEKIWENVFDQKVLASFL